MLKLAFTFELRRLLRSRTAVLAMVGFLAVGLLATFIGQMFVGQWQDALVTAATAQEESISKARGFLEKGEKGPADYPWVDLTQPMWQDWYAGTRIAREPGGLAGIAAGAMDPAPAVFRINRLADPLEVGGYRIENPELATGAVDLVFVLAILLPLLLGVLGSNIGSQERETGLDRLVVVRAGSERRWLVMRMVAVTLIAGGAAAAICVIAGWIGGAGWADIGALIALSLVYSTLWGGLVLAINARAKSVRGAVFAFGSLWMLLCVLLPSLGAEFSLGKVQAEYALMETLEARELRYDMYERKPATILPALYERYPELEALPAAADETLDQSIARHAHDGLLVAEMMERHGERIDVEMAARTLAERSSWVSPAVALSLSLERLAGVGNDAAASYRSHLVSVIDERVRWVLTNAWGKATLDADDFEALVATSTQPFQARATGVGPVLVPLVAWALAAWLIAIAIFTRTGRRLATA